MVYLRRGINAVPPCSRDDGINTNAELFSYGPDAAMELKRCYEPLTVREHRHDLLWQLRPALPSWNPEPLQRTRDPLRRAADLRCNGDSADPLLDVLLAKPVAIA